MHKLHALILAFVMVGCGNPALSRFKTEYGCRAARSQSLGGGAVRVQGCGVSATYVCMRNSRTGYPACVQESRGAISTHPRRSASPGQPGAAATVRKSTNREGDALIRLEYAQTWGTLWLIAKPSEAGRTLMMVAELHARCSVGCAPQLVLNGQRVEATQEAVRPTGKDLAFRVLAEVLAQIPDADRATWKIGLVEWTMTADERAQLGEFLATVRDTQAFAGAGALEDTSAPDAQVAPQH